MEFGRCHHVEPNICSIWPKAQILSRKSYFHGNYTKQHQMILFSRWLHDFNWKRLIWPLIIFDPTSLAKWCWHYQARSKLIWLHIAGWEKWARSMERHENDFDKDFCFAQYGNIWQTLVDKKPLAHLYISRTYVAINFLSSKYLKWTANYKHPILVIIENFQISCIFDRKYTWWNIT